MRCNEWLTIGAITAVSEVANTATPSTMIDAANGYASGVSDSVSPYAGEVAVGSAPSTV